MRSWLLVLPCWCLLTGFLSAQATWFEGWRGEGAYAAVVCGYAHAGTPDGSFQLQGIPSGASIESAVVYGHNWFSANTTSISINGTALGSATPFAQSAAGGVHAYRWDASGVVTGDGTYSVTSTGFNNTYGMVLAVIYSDPSLGNRQVIVQHGAIEIDAALTGSTTFDARPGEATLWLYTQADDDGATGESILWNDEVVGGPIDANLGDFASGFRIDLQAGGDPDRLDLLSPSDHFGLQLAVLEVEDIGPQLMPPIPGATGVLNTLALEDAQPGATVNLVFGRTPGQFPVGPFCPNLLVDLADPVFVAAATADANGHASFSVVVPPRASGVPVLLQAADLGACAVSNLLPFTFP